MAKAIDRMTALATARVEALARLVAIEGEMVTVAADLAAMVVSGAVTAPQAADATEPKLRKPRTPKTAQGPSNGVPSDGAEPQSPREAAAAEGQVQGLTESELSVTDVMPIGEILSGGEILQRLIENGTIGGEADVVPQSTIDAAKADIRAALAVLIERGIVERSGEGKGTKYARVRDVTAEVVAD
jgi:hypothetical protein